MPPLRSHCQCHHLQSPPIIHLLLPRAEILTKFGKLSHLEADNWSKVTGFLAWDLPRAGNAKYLRFSLNCANQLLANLTSSLVIRQFPTLILVAEGVWVFWGWYVQRPHYLLTAWSDQFPNLNWTKVQEDRSCKMLTSLNLCWTPWHIVTSNKGRLISKGGVSHYWNCIQGTKQETTAFYMKSAFGPLISFNLDRLSPCEGNLPLSWTIVALLEATHQPTKRSGAK